MLIAFANIRTSYVPESFNTHTNIVDRNLWLIQFRLTLYSKKTVKATKNTHICLLHPIRPSTTEEILPEAFQQNHQPLVYRIVGWGNCLFWTSLPKKHGSQSKTLINYKVITTKAVGLGKRSRRPQRRPRASNRNIQNRDLNTLKLIRENKIQEKTPSNTENENTKQKIYYKSNRHSATAQSPWHRPKNIQKHG